jgi:hypothetical protein
MRFPHPAFSLCPRISRARADTSGGRRSQSSCQPCTLNDGALSALTLRAFYPMQWMLGVEREAANSRAEMVHWHRRDRIAKLLQRVMADNESKSREAGELGGD